MFSVEVAALKKRNFTLLNCTEMKKMFFLLLFCAGLFPAQDLEDLQEGFVFSETSKNFFRVEIARPFDYYKVAGCSDQSQFIRAQFPGGDAAFNRELHRYIAAYIDRDLYVVNGPFYLHVDINTAGKVTGLNITPKVENASSFLRDLRFAFNQIKTRWTPSMCDGVPVNSRIRIKLNFETETTDL